ncbi:MAG: cation-transporting ATPase [Candidatus Pacebacteria bacterium CG_4_10_14_3_um_filter_34_15]|nr:HAD-IC family P-type ATPase [Candidatus Pacearchaeota archaeon]NCQ65533.1 HAD-IC family P-type ATPase [Candidatus Paceibacterota bacterium]PIQ81279.1 MAG: cation-transporting ATPase [Candidatus Pacebacteria bacterium CG11_big_fil_rev_8_21_14_0_20_34_55]PIX81106.1 MAG: cation-transporting ATPase [Candidatus Pacebacteria bacterium CG_4_10_14_3_um_filter_34_15]PJC43825.1 MAG: cation-transporting ATPase [Candidatus Pacebacteria bacterium CG_4_9_14_0_2_um_filter_34_50]
MAKNNLLYEEYLENDEVTILNQLDSSANGLTNLEAQKKLLINGRNVLKAHKISWVIILFRQFKSPFIYLLIGAALLAFFLKELIDGFMILGFILINSILGFFQEFRSEQALKMLKKITTSNARVLRDNAEILIPVDQLVPGDIIKLQPGDIVPADVHLIESNNLQVNESILTGESEPSLKSAKPLSSDKVPIHKASNILFSSTVVTSGQGSGIVFATGAQTYIGSIAKLTVETHPESNFEKGMGKFSTFVLKLVGFTLSLVIIINLLLKGGTTNIGDLIIFSIALATAVIPEALPLVITFSLSRGAIKLAKHKVVVKRLSAIEDLGSIQVLCADKTGTITENKLEVSEIFGEKDNVITHANMAISQKSIHKDPFDIAFESALEKQSLTIKSWTIGHEIPFDPDRKRNSVLALYDNKNLLIVRGAAESILHHLKNNPDDKLTSWILNQEKQGKRVIVIAHRFLKDSDEYTKNKEEKDLVLTGAISLIDPLKKSAPEAIKKAQKLGIAFKIITGDSPVVAGSIGFQVGLVKDRTDVITAEKFFTLDIIDQKKAAANYNIFARFSPHEKYELINILKEEFEVGYLGEGINDAPALKSANVALVVHGASDIARESADIILLNKSLRVIVDGIQEGREVFANTTKYVKITLASNFGNFYAVAIISLLIDYLPMLPIQILLINLLSDFPLIAVATDSVDIEDIKNPETYNLREFIVIATLIGMVSTLFDFIYFATFSKISPSVLHTNWFIGSILTELLLVYSLRTKFVFYKSKAPSLTIFILTIAAILVTVIIPFTTIGQNIFKFTQPTANQLLTVFSIALLYFVSTEITKNLYYKFRKNVKAIQILI